MSEQNSTSEGQARDPGDTGHAGLRAGGSDPHTELSRSFAF